MTKSFDREYKHYQINNKQVHCKKFKETNSESNQSLSKEDKICKAIDSIQGSILYNAKRMGKLSDEYKCAYNYKQLESDPKPMPNCKNSVYRVFENKFNNAEKLAKTLSSKYTHASKINLNELLSESEQSLIDFKSLAQFTYSNKNIINAAFEQADYDTNVSGGLALLFGVFAAPLAIAGHMINVAVSNNEFDGKIDRAIRDIESTIDSARDLSYLLGSFSEYSEIYN